MESRPYRSQLTRQVPAALRPQAGALERKTCGYANALFAVLGLLCGVPSLLTARPRMEPNSFDGVLSVGMNIRRGDSSRQPSFFRILLGSRLDLSKGTNIP